LPGAWRGEEPSPSPRPTPRGGGRGGRKYYSTPLMGFWPGPPKLTGMASSAPSEPRIHQFPVASS